MSEAVHDRSGFLSRPMSPELARALETTAAAAEIAVRAAAGAVGVRAVVGLVRDYPLLSVLLATGIGCVLGSSWHARRGQPAQARVGTAEPKRLDRA